MGTERAARGARSSGPGEAGAIAAQALLPLMAWLSPSYPVGAFAYSHGLEWAVEAGDVRDEATLSAWLADLVARGAGRNDAILFAAAYRAAQAGDRPALEEINALALALAPSAELYLETAQQGRSFQDATLAAWPAAGLDALSGDVAYPVAVARAAAAHGLPLDQAAPAYVFGFVQNLVSAAVRLAPIGQTTGTRVLSALAPIVAEVAARALAQTLDDLGSATFRADLGSLRHETQYTRLFRS